MSEWLIQNSRVEELGPDGANDLGNSSIVAYLNRPATAYWPEYWVGGSKEAALQIGEQIAKNHNDNARLLGLLAGLVAGDPITYNETDSWCFFCGKYDVFGQEFVHEPDCPWLLARQFLDAKV